MSEAPKGAKRVPERTCVACCQKKPKWEMIRIVRTPQGTLEIDSRGKKAGRGAYLCKQRSCWETGLTKKKLEHALRIQVSPEQRASLLESSKALF